jgi:transposase
VAQPDWPGLCRRIEDILGGQSALTRLAPELEELAQRLAAQLLVRSPTPEGSPRRFVEVDPDSIQMLRARSVGVEHAGLHAMDALGFAQLLGRLGFNEGMRAAAIGSVIARMAAPGSELASWKWLRHESALGELVGADFEAMPLMRLYRVSDALLKHKSAIETALFSRVETLFGLEATVTLYDLTNTYFEGAVRANPKAARGHSKEKRTDCPLVTLGLVLDGSGFVRRSQVFAGNAVEARTLTQMLNDLDAPKAALVILDRGIATEENLDWLKAQGYRYLVVARAAKRQFDPRQAAEFVSASGERLRVQKVIEGKEARLYCHSSGRSQKEAAIAGKLTRRLEAGLEKLAAGLSRPRTDKRLDRLHERIGRLKQRCQGIGQHYAIEVHSDANGKTARALTWQRLPRPASQLTDPGVYVLRTNELSWEPERLWRTYVMLTDLEAVFRSLKSELGLRPIYHSKEARTDGHLFITVLAYQFVQFIRTQLAAQGIHESWASLRAIFAVQRRVTAAFTQRDGRTLNVRKATLAEPQLERLYEALGIDAAPGGTRKLIA